MVCETSILGSRDLDFGEDASRLTTRRNQRMRGRNLQLARPMRLLWRLVALPCAVLLLVAYSTQAGTVLQFAQVNAADTVTATESDGVTTLSTAGNPVMDGGPSSIAVTLTNFNGAPAPPIPVFETFIGVTSTGTATMSGGQIAQLFSGTIEFTVNPGPASASNPDFLTATFTNAVFLGTTNSASLTVSAPDLTLSSSMATFGTVTGMAIGFSGINSTPLGINNGSVASFTAQNSGTFSAAAVPEPSTLCLASFATAIGALAYGRKKMRNVA
jgi:hypothetical protein